nr:putative G-protein coupled receptor [Biomphalaria glabrata]
MNVTLSDNGLQGREILRRMKESFSELEVTFKFAHFIMARSTQLIMRNTFSVFYLDHLIEKIDIGIEYTIRFISKSSINKTQNSSSPCYRYISFIFSSSSGLLQNLKYFVNPTLALLGLCQNILCVLVLRKDGFSKTSNINLLSVIVAGSFQQMLSVNVAEVLEFESGLDMYEEVEELTCVKKKDYVLQTFKHIFLFLGTWGQYVFSSTFMLITIERVLVVFLPFTFKDYVKKKYMVAGLFTIFLIWLPFVMFKIICLYGFEILLTYPIKESYKVDLSWLADCHYLATNIAITILVLGKCIPLVLVLLGSLVIAIRIKITLNKRSKLTSLPHKLSWSMQTTKVLLATCLLFSISDVLQYILSYVAVHFITDPDISFFVHSEFISFSYLFTSCNTFFIFISTNKRLLGHVSQFIQSIHKSPQTASTSM